MSFGRKVTVEISSFAGFAERKNLMSMRAEEDIRSVNC
jgi:hypothetical protein